VSHSGYLKRTPITTYRQQRRGGTGRTGMKTRDEDFVEHLFIASTHAYILISPIPGVFFWLKVYEVPDVAPRVRANISAIWLDCCRGIGCASCRSESGRRGQVRFFATRKGTVRRPN